MIHGVLHYIGFKDKTEKDQIEMTRQENLALVLLNN
jgi:ssRNA-specific RNase YbeY (16S rRNA maturation enzyme)